MESKKIGGINIYSGNLEMAVSDFILAVYSANDFNSFRISATSAHGFVEAWFDETFKDILNSSYCNLPDGLPIVWLGKIFRVYSMKRCYGPSFFRNVILLTKNMSITHFFCGGKPGVSLKLKETVNLWGNLNVVGTFTPPYGEMSKLEWDKLLCQINNENPFAKPGTNLPQMPR